MGILGKFGNFGRKNQKASLESRIAGEAAAKTSRAKTADVKKKFGTVKVADVKKKFETVKVADVKKKFGTVKVADVKKKIEGETREAAKRERKISERDKVRSRGRRRSVVSGIFMLAMIAGVGYLVFDAGRAFFQYLNEKKSSAETEAVEETVVASVDIVDESGSEAISNRVREYVGLLEGDLKDLGYEVEHVVLPDKNVREVDVYVVGRNEYYKCHLDRGTAVTAEDMVRMMRYLDENGVGEVGYVDVRVAGKAWYK